MLCSSAAKRIGMARGKFITFEGGEGAGKSTQIGLLATALRATGLDVVVTREPGGSRFAEAIRALLLDNTSGERSALAEALLFAAARADHLERLIRPALARGQWVLCDRFADSTRAYQGGADAVPLAVIEQLERMVVGDTRPDLTIILDLPVEEGLRRAAQRQHARSGAEAAADAFEARDHAYHDRLRAAFLAIARAEPGRCVVIDAERSADDIARDVRAAVAERLGV